MNNDFNLDFKVDPKNFRGFESGPTPDAGNCPPVSTDDCGRLLGRYVGFFLSIRMSYQGKGKDKPGDGKKNKVHIIADQLLVNDLRDGTEIQ